MTTDRQSEDSLASAEELHRMRAMFARSPSFSALLQGPEHRFVLTNPAYNQLIGHRNVIGLTVREAVPEVEGQGFQELDFVYQPIKDESGRVTSIFVEGLDITERRATEQALRELNANLERRVIERAQARGRTWNLSPDLLVGSSGAYRS